jgi:hypothetical protein
MAQKNGRKAALTAELEMCRGEMHASLVACSQSLNVVQRMRRSFRSHAKEWYVAGAVGGFALTLWVAQRMRRPATSKAEKTDRSSLMGTLYSKALGMGVEMVSDMIRPAVLAWVSSIISQRQAPPAASDPGGESNVFPQTNRTGGHQPR